MLIAWKRREGSGASYHVLTEALSLCAAQLPKGIKSVQKDCVGNIILFLILNYMIYELDILLNRLQYMYNRVKPCFIHSIHY